MFIRCSRSLRALLLASGFASLLAACGGGGSDSPPPPPPPPPVSKPTLSFSPATVTASVMTGTSEAVSVSGVVNTPADFNNANAVYAFVVDTAGVIIPQVEMSLSGTTLRAMMHTSPTLASGTYEGNFTVKVCRDASCNQQFPGSPMQLPYKFTVAPAPLVLHANVLSNTINVGASPPAPTTIQVFATNATWSATTASPWIKLAGSSGSGAGAITVSYDVTGLLAGSYAGTILVTASDGQKSELPVALVMLPRAFSIQSGKIFFNAINGAPMAPQAVNFSLPGTSDTWTASTESPWLTVTPTSGTTPATTTLSIDPSVGKLVSGTHLNSVSFSSPSANTGKVPVELQLTKATLSTTVATMALGGTYGRELLPSQTKLHLNTSSNSHPFTLTTPPSWLSANALSGTVNQTGTNLTFTPVVATTPVGTTTTTLTATATVNGDTISVPINVTVNRDQRKLLFSEAGVAFSSTPSWSRLTRTVSVKDNFGLPSNWTVSTNQPWLTATKLGNQVTLTANPAALPADVISYATVTLSTSDSGITTPEPLQVALWKGSVTPSTITSVSKSYTYVKADPIRPLVYANDGSSTIDVYNVYTAALVGTMSNLGASLGEMTVSPSGDHLYTYDTANRNIVVVDLKTRAKTATWPLATAVGYLSRLLAIRPNGVNIVLAADGHAYLASSGKSVGMPNSTAPFAATSDGNTIYSESGVFKMDYSEMGGGALFSSAQSGVSGDDVATSGDGTRLYVATGWPYRCNSISPTDFSVIGALPGGEHYPNNVEVSTDGRVFCGISGWYSAADVWVHDSNGTLLNSYKFAGYAKNLLTRQLTISGDSLIMIGLTNDPLLAFVPVGP